MRLMRSWEVDKKAAMCLELKSLESDNIALGKMNSTKRRWWFLYFPRRTIKVGRRGSLMGAGELIQFSLLHKNALMTIPCGKSWFLFNWLLAWVCNIGWDGIEHTRYVVQTAVRPRTRDPPASGCWVLELQAHTTIASLPLVIISQLCLWTNFGIKKFRNEEL